MGYAERIYERVKALSDKAAEEVLDFAEVVASRVSTQVFSATVAVLRRKDMLDDAHLDSVLDGSLRVVNPFRSSPITAHDPL